MVSEIESSAGRSIALGGARSARQPVLSTAMGFDEASGLVLDYLSMAMPMALWAVTRRDGDEQVTLTVRDGVYGVEAGERGRWADSYCARMAAGLGPAVAFDLAMEPVYADVPAGELMAARAYVGVPITGRAGELFGTLCALDPTPRAPDLAEGEVLLRLLATLLSGILEADRLRVEQARALERERHASLTDPLTGLVNRRGWSQQLQIEEARFRRFGDRGSVVVIDLDNLKRINDTAGHAAGDRHLILAASAIGSATRATDLVARLGGDEFGIIVAEGGAGEAEELVDRLAAALDRVGVAASIGCAPYAITSGFAGAWEQADAAMYAEKRRRRAERLARRASAV